MASSSILPGLSSRSATKIMLIARVVAPHEPPPHGESRLIEQEFKPDSAAATRRDILSCLDDRSDLAPAPFLLLLHAQRQGRAWHGSHRRQRGLVKFEKTLDKCSSPTPNALRTVR